MNRDPCIIILTESTPNSFWSEGNLVPRVKWRSIRGRSASPLTATPSRLAMTDLRGRTPSLEILPRGPSGPMWRRITFEQRLDTSQSLKFSRFKLWIVFHHHYWPLLGGAFWREYWMVWVPLLPVWSSNWECDIHYRLPQQTASLELHEGCISSCSLLPLFCNSHRCLREGYSK